MEKRAAQQDGLGPRRAWAVTVCSVLFLAVVFGVLIYRLYTLQIRDYARYKITAVEQQISDNIIPATRGAIYDATGKVLARSTVVWNIVCDPSKTDEDIASQAASEIARLTGADREEIYNKLTADNAYQILAKKVDKATADAVKEYASDLNRKAERTVIYIALEKSASREYPYGAFLSTVLGFCNDEGQGFYGLERSYNELLAGTDGRSLTEENAWGYDMSTEGSQQFDPIDGVNLHLTINATIQTVVQNYIDAAAERYNVQNRACAIVMEVKTGKLLALANTDNYDPNDPYSLQDELFLDALATQGELSELQISRLKNRLGDRLVEEILEDAEISDDEYGRMQGIMREAQWKNKAITELYMPGSVYKVITSAAALDSGILNPMSSFYCPGYYEVADHVYRCADYETKGTSHGVQDMAMALANSCNVYCIQAGQTLGAVKLYDYFKAFGFTETTGVDLPYETPWMQYYTAKQMGATELASTSFGQAQAITPLQMCTAISAAVNGGYLVTPYLLDYCTDAAGNVVSTSEPNIKRQVVSEEVSAELRHMMNTVMVVSGKNAQVPGYDMGGKSGTTEQLNQSRRGDGDYKKVSSFVAVLPISDPEILVYVMLDDPRSYNDYASQIVAPIVGNIVSEIAPYLGIATNAETEVTGNVQVPYILEYDVGSAQARLNQSNLEHRLVGSGKTVIAQYPVAGATVPAGSTIYLYTESETMTSTTVPTVVGYSSGQAKQLMSAAGLNVELTGASSGTIQSQSLEGGESVPVGTVVTLEVVDTSTGE